MKKPLILFFLLVTASLSAEDIMLVINEVLVSTNEIEILNAGDTEISILNLRIQNGGQEMTITDATTLTCGDYFLAPGEIAVVPVSFSLDYHSGEFYVSRFGQIPIAYVQWGEIGTFATTAFSQELWDDPLSFLPEIPQGSSMELVSAPDRTSINGWLTQDEPTPCDDNTQCQILLVALRDLSCIENGTPSDPSDDYFEFTLDVEGLNLPEYVDLSIEGMDLDPASYPVNCTNCFITSFGVGGEPSANGEDLVLQIIADNGECSFDLDFVAPESCSPECEMQASQFIFLDCLDNNTPQDPTDDYIEFIVRPFGFNLSDEYYVSFSTGESFGPLPNSAPFEIISSEGWYSPGDGDFSVTIIDGDDDACSETIFISDFDHCSPNCVVSLDSLAVTCEDSGTPYDDSDDFYRVEIMVSSTASASTEFQLSLTPFLAAPEMLAYDELHTFESAPGSTDIINNYAMTVIDPAYPSCIGVTLNGILTEGCLTECVIETPEINLPEGQDICIEPDDESIFTFEETGIVLESFFLLALDPDDHILFITDKLTFDAHELGTGVFNFVLVNYLAINGLELGGSVDSLGGCFAISPIYRVEISFEENCSTSTEEEFDKVNIFPNPVYDLLCLEGMEQYEHFYILDLTGGKVLSGEIKPCMDVSRINRGAFILVLTTMEGKNVSQKIVKL